MASSIFPTDRHSLSISIETNVKSKIMVYVLLQSIVIFNETETPENI